MVGHSVGAYAAAALAGLFRRRRRSAGRRPGAPHGVPCPPGAMAAIAAPAPVVAAARRYDPAHLAIAAVNTPTETVVSGAARPPRGAGGRAHRPGHRLPAVAGQPGLPFSSHRTRPRRPGRRAGHRRPGAGGQSFISDTTGAPAGPDAATTAYWVGHSRRPVQFATALQALYEPGRAALVELGPGTTLLSMARATLPADGLSLLPSLHAGTDPRQRLHSSLAELWARGQRVDWRALTGPAPRELPRPAHLPLPAPTPLAPRPWHG